MAAEVLDNDLDLLGQRGWMQAGEACYAPLRTLSNKFWIVFDGFLQGVVGPVGHVVLQHVEDEALLDGLPHGVQMEWVGQAVCTKLSETLQGHVARGRGETKVA